MSKIHYINANDFGGGGGGSGGSDVDLSQYATKLYSDSEDTKVKEYVDSQLDSLELPDTEINLDGYATQPELEEVDRNSQQRDEALQKEIDELSEQIDLDDSVFEGSLKWVDANWNPMGAPIDAVVNEVKIHIARTAIVFNKDTIDGDKVLWEEIFKPSPMTIGLQVEDDWYWAVVEYIGDGGQNDRGKNFKILEHNLPPSGEVPAQTVTNIYSNYTPSPYATIEYSDEKDNEIWAGINDLETEIRTNSYRVSTVLDEDAVGEVVFSNPNAQYTSQGSITFSQKDLSGHSIHWSLIKPGWAFTITEKNSDNYAVGEIKSINAGSNTAQIKILDGEGAPTFGDILHFSGSPYAPMSHEETTDYATVDYADEQDTKILASANTYTDEVAATLDTGTDVTADYDWTGHHKYTGGNVVIDNTDGGVTYDGWKSDYSGSNERSWMKFLLNATSEYYLHFGPTSTYWETRWTLNTGKMTWAQTHTATPSVEIDKYGLKVKGSSVTRNATMLQALKSSTDFDSLKAKLVELLEEEAASYEVEEEAC